MKGKTNDLLYTCHNVFVTHPACTTNVTDSVEQSHKRIILLFPAAKLCCIALGKTGNFMHRDFDLVMAYLLLCARDRWSL